MVTTATATTSRSRRALDSRSGGKFVRPRRSTGARTPYDRPRLVNPAPPENPSWFSRLIYSPTRKIASGAGKIISSVIGPDSSSSSSSSSDDGDDDDDDDDEDISTQEDDGLNKRNGTSEEIKFLGKEPPSTLGKSDNKHVIEQLLIKETFSKEECDRLIKIIKSRVVGFTNAEDAENTRPDAESPVMEAKKWLSEKRLGSTSKPVLDHGTHTLSSLMFPQGGEDEGGSPVDVAKVFMRARPSWASPSIKHGELRSPSSIGMQHFDEETPYSTGGNSAPTSKLKRDAPATGSWNIQEEIRRVRSKATEELLRSLPSTRIDWSASALEKRNVLGSLPGGQREDDVGDQLHNCKYAIVSEKTQYGLQKEDFPLPDSDAASMDGKGDASCTQNALEEMFSSGQRLEASEYIKTAPSDAGGGDFDGHKDPSRSEQQNPVVGGTVQDSKLHDATCSMTEVTASRSAYTANGFPSSVAGLSAQLNTAENAVLNGESNAVSPSHEIAATDLTLDDIREFLNEPTVEVTNKNENDIGGTMENDGVYLNEATVEVHELIETYIDVTKDNDFVASGSQNSHSMPDDLSQELTQPSPVAKTDTVVEKQKGRRLSRNNRRGRSRGK
ncbi:unnamed protein product [Malus baccata var. baccata]